MEGPGLKIVSYELHFDVDFRNSVVKGTSRMTVKGSESPLALDSVGLGVKRVLVNGSPSRFRVDRKKGKLVVKGVPRKESVVEVGFTKRVDDDSIFGLYKSRYGEEHLLVTDLEPAEGRTVFPCKDEPSYKAVFKVTVVTERGLSVISNTQPATREEVSGGRARVVFEPTFPMSTYLFFLGVGRFEDASKTSDGVTVIAATRPGMARDTGQALDHSAAVLKGFGEYFGIPYPMKKLHIVGLPEYHVGAMENWGAIAARESLVAVTEGASTVDKRRSAHVLTHEIAHMWFGDLVTMKWWDDLWLNESFASFMDDKMVEKLHPEWDTWTDFLQRGTFPSLNMDALSTTHPIQVSVKSVDEVQGIFDAISYGKGAAVLRMLESFVGEEAFRKGVSEYLRKFSYSNASGKDLWTALANASGLPVTRVAEAWITRPGFPLVTASRSRGRVLLRQRRFLLTGSSRGGPWPIPLQLEAGGESKKLLFDTRRDSVEVGDGLVVLNPRRRGFYSVLYDEGMYDELARSFDRLHPHDVAGIMGDLFLFLQAGMVDPKTFFRFVSLSAKVHHPLVAMAVSDQLTDLWAIAGESEAVRDSCVSFSSSQMDGVGLTPKAGEDENLSEVREWVALLLARTSPDFAKRLAGTFEGYESVRPELVRAAATAFAVTQGEAAFGPLKESVKGARSELERLKLYPALTSFRDPKLVEKALDLPVTGEVSRSDSRYSVLGAAQNPYARDALWGWVKKRYSKVYEIYGGSQSFYTMMNGALKVCGVGRANEVKRFVSGERYRKGKMTYRRTFELLKVGSRLRDKLLKGG